MFFLSPKSLDDDPLRIGIAFGGPAFFQQRATQHLNEKCMCKMMKNDTEK